MLAVLPHPGRILIAFVPRHQGERLVAAAKKAGARGGTISPGLTFSHSRVLQALALAGVRQDVVFTLMGPEAGAVVAGVQAAGTAEPRKLAGTALVLTVGEMYARGNPKNNGTESSGTESEKTSRAESADTGARSVDVQPTHKLITVIVNAGVAEDVMAAARRAGASGGSIIGARGTGTEADVKFFGITLVPEKEMLMVVSPAGKVDAIARAVAEVPELNQPGGGVMFTMNVEEFIVLGEGAPAGAAGRE